MSFTVGELAGRLGGAVEGDADRVLEGVRSLEDAGSTHLAFLSNPRYRRQLKTTRAGAVLVAPGVDAGALTVIRLDDPYAAFAAALGLFHPQRWPEGGIHPQAAVSERAELGPGVTVEPFAVVGPGARVGAGTWIQSGAFVGAGAVVGAQCRLMPTSVVMDGCALGDRVWLNPGAIVGSEGFGFAPTAAGLIKIPQVGIARVEDDVELGANTCVDRAALGTTRVGQGAKLDNLCQVGHAAEIGPHNCLVAYAGVAGTSKLGVGVTLAARTSVLGHIEVGDGVIAAAHTMVAQTVPAGGRVSGVPAIPHTRWLRAARSFGDVPAMERRMRKLEARLAELEARLGEPEEGQ